MEPGTQSDWLKLAVESLVLLGAVGIFLGYFKKLGGKLDSLSEMLTGVRLDLKSCVIWSEFDREIGPIRDKVDSHHTRLAVVESRCDSRCEAEKR